MRFIHLLLLGILVSTRVSAHAVHHRLHAAQTFKVKCESLLYRSIVQDNACVFAVNIPMPFDDGAKQCGLILPGSVMDTTSKTVFNLLALDPMSYHSESTTGQTKGVLCRYDNRFKCADDERSDMAGKCMKKFEAKTFAKAKKFCKNRQSSALPVVDNDDDNKAIAGLLSSNERAWLDQSSSGGRWLVRSKEEVRFFNWIFGGPSDLQCDKDQVVTVSGSREGKCANYALWEAFDADEKRTVICVRDAEDSYTHTPNSKPGEVEPTAPVIDPSSGDDGKLDKKLFWNVKCYFNYEQEVHAFCADEKCVDKIQNNGIGYSSNKGITKLGKAIREGSIAEARAQCPKGSKHLVNLGFTKDGTKYVHNFGGEGVSVGWVSLKEGACGATLPIKRWTSSKSLQKGAEDMKYGEDMEWNIWYKGRVQDGGKVHFYMWKLNEIPPKESQLWTVSCYFNYKLEVHAFCATPDCVNVIMANGIGYESSQGRTTLGRAIRTDAIGAVRKACPVGALNLVKLGFTREGATKYIHNFEGEGLMQGWVSTTYDMCGAKKGIKRWTSSKSLTHGAEDMKYGDNMEWNIWYQGRVQDGGAVLFWMWD